MIEEKNARFIPSGRELDTYIGGGFRENKLNLVSSRPGMGTTTWLFKSAFHISQNSQNILYITLQSSIPDLIEYAIRVIGSEKLTSIPAHSFEIAEAYDVNMEKLEKLIVSNIEAHQTNVVFVDTIDYLFTKKNRQLISSKTTIDDENEVIEEFQKFSDKYNLTFIIGKELPSMKKSRINKRPLLTDVQSKMKTNHFPLIIGLYREEVYDPDTSNDNEIEVHMLKSPVENAVTSYTEVFDKNRKEKNQV